MKLGANSQAFVWLGQCLRGFLNEGQESFEGSQTVCLNRAVEAFDEVESALEIEEVDASSSLFFEDDLPEDVKAFSSGATAILYYRCAAGGSGPVPLLAVFRRSELGDNIVFVNPVQDDPEKRVVWPDLCREHCQGLVSEGLAILNHGLMKTAA